jgi:Asp-tRNA(Asn)/Glu-tRNA(Gln) amidotransferase A subunit family amidase
MSDIDSEDVRAVAEAYGMTVSDEEAAGIAEVAATTATRLGSLQPSEPEGEAASGVREGDDEYNAFFRRFDLPSGDGPLADLDLAVKENTFVAGVESTCGSPAFSFTPEYSATVVSRLRDAGGNLVGTTNMDEFALKTTGESCAHGEIQNPAAPERVPGGSSSGSGAAVAAGLVDAALGSDTGGSIRIPASYCGVVGLKPTHGAVPRYGFADLAPSLDHVGPLATDVETAARVFDAIAGPDVNDPSSWNAPRETTTADAVGEDVDDLRVGLVDAAFSTSDDAVADTVRAAVEDLPVTVESVSLPTFATPLALTGIIGTEFVSLVERDGQVYATGTGYSEPYREAMAAVDPDEFGPNVRQQLLLAKAVLAEGGGSRYVAAQNARRDFTRQTEAALAEFDALVSPTTPSTALAFGAVETQDDLVNTLANTAPWNLTGHPALSVPCGEVEGRPVGLQVTTDRFDEATAVALGSAVTDEA